MSGVDLQRHLVATGWHRPIIFITAFPEEGGQSKAAEPGAVCVLAKPFDGKTLIACLNCVLQGGQ